MRDTSDRDPGSPLRPPETFEIVLRTNQMLSPVVKELTFERADGKPMHFEAGQWVNLLIPQQEGEIKRAYSIASAPGGHARLQFAITHVEGGPGSTYLHRMEVGDSLRAVGPQGLFVRRHGGPALFVGTGTGVTPLRSMFQHALAQGETAPLWLLFGVRHEEDRIYEDELRELAAAYPNFKVFYTLSQPKGGASGTWGGRTGYVQTHARALYEEMTALGQGDVHVYICGLQKMIGNVRDLLRKEMELPRQLVHSERYD